MNQLNLTRILFDPEYLGKLAQGIGKFFESSEVHEKKLLLKMTLQNYNLMGKKPDITE